MTLPGPLFWLVIQVHHFQYFLLRHPAISAQCGLHLWWQSEWIALDPRILWVHIVTGAMWHSFLIGNLIFILFLVPLVVIIGIRVHVHPKCKLKYSPILFQSYLFSGDIVSVHEDAKGLFSLLKDSGKFYCCRVLYLADWSIEA